MQKQVIFFLLTLTYFVNSEYSYSSSSSSSCKRFENNIYQLTVTFPDKRPFNAAIRLLPKGVFDEIFAIANGNNADETGANFAMSTRFGYFKCYPKNRMLLTAIGYLYKTPDVPFLNETGAVVVHDYHFSFRNNDKKCDGLVKYAVFKSGTNPFTTKDKPVFEGETGKVKCELLRFHSYYKLPKP